MSKRVPTPAGKRLHAESLLRIPLVRRALSHPSIRPRPRALDRTWTYRKLVSSGHVGFVPFTQEVLYGSISKTATWLRRRESSARPLNAEDFLVTEVLWVVHDFIHAWALATVMEVAPGLRIHPGLSADEREELVFAHLVTEAAAAVGLDYWYLSVVDPNDLCPIGTLQFPLTTDYREKDLREIRRARPGLTVQRPGFFHEMVTLFNEGKIRGFEYGSLERSPVTARWLVRELNYSRSQREYTRRWLDHVTGSPELAESARPLASRPRWGRDLVELLARRLWRLAKDDVDEAPTARAVLPVEPRPRATTPFDPRFMNMRLLEPDALLAEAARIHDPLQRGYFCDQYVCTFEHSKLDGALVPAVLLARKQRDVEVLHALLARAPQVSLARNELTDIFLLG